MYACFGLIPLPHTVLTYSETPCQLSQRVVKLHVNRVDTEWDSTPTESTQKAPWRFHHSALTQLLWSLNPLWLSQRGVSLCVDSVEGEWDFSSTESLPNVKILNKSANSITKLKTRKSLIIWPTYVWSVQKKLNKKSHASVPLIRVTCMGRFIWETTESGTRARIGTLFEKKKVSVSFQYCNSQFLVVSIENVLYLN